MRQEKAEDAAELTQGKDENALLSEFCPGTFADFWLDGVLERFDKEQTPKNGLFFNGQGGF